MALLGREKPWVLPETTGDPLDLALKHPPNSTAFRNHFRTARNFKMSANDFDVKKVDKHWPLFKTKKVSNGNLQKSASNSEATEPVALETRPAKNLRKIRESVQIHHMKFHKSFKHVSSKLF